MNPDIFQNDPIWNYLLGGGAGRDLGNVGNALGQGLSFLGLNPISEYQNIDRTWGPVNRGFANNDFGPFERLAKNRLLDAGESAVRFGQLPGIPSILPNNALLQIIAHARPKPPMGAQNATVNPSQYAVPSPTKGIGKKASPMPADAPKKQSVSGPKAAGYAMPPTAAKAPNRPNVAMNDPMNVPAGRNRPNPELSAKQDKKNPKSAGAQVPAQEKRAQMTQDAPRGQYTIEAGDTLNGIAKKLGYTKWHDLLARNPWIRENPDLIKPGQVIDY